jgi:hypothetical protein
MVLAVGTGDVAMPSLFVLTVIEVKPPNEALAPVEGAVNVTRAPGTGIEEESVTFA